MTTGSSWRAERNERSRARLTKALPAVFPVPVLDRALARPLIPPLPRLAVDGYWRAHPLRADRLARALAAMSGAPEGWSWRLADAVRTRGEPRSGLPASFRVPPAPWREAAFARGGGWCCVCGQPVYRFGWHVDLWARGPNRNAEWHAACVAAWQFWTAPTAHVALLRRLQQRRCAARGKRLWRTAEIDHRVPLFEVWRDRRDTPWPDLLAYWGLPNLQVINRDVHVEKCAEEARGRSRARRTADGPATGEPRTATSPQDTPSA
ncbi:hypothetical protein [Rhodoplanes serenus]|uniref:hypothetical protein n=1 Tax=Rhodoplanes serenus TaxID=200615 RepID=UPI0025461BCC|nr:hypothetical protein [Rhodoplanes serenus]